MSKYFEESKSTTINAYIDYEKQTGGYNKEQKIKDARNLRDIIGDAKIPRKIIETLAKQFHIVGGKYDVRTNPETLNGLYNIYCKFPKLSANAIDELATRYINDLFEEYSLSEILEKMINENGETDSTFEKYLETIDKAAEEQDKRYFEESKLLDQYKSEYQGINFMLDYIEYLKSLVIREHIPVKRLIEHMPEKELIIKDCEHLSKVSKQSRVYTGVCIPLSYRMTRLAAKDELENINEQLTYYVSTTGTDLPATFTKSEFIASTKKHKQKIKI